MKFVKYTLAKKV